MTDLGPLRQAVAEAERQRALLGPDATPPQRQDAFRALGSAREVLHTALREFTDAAPGDELLSRLDPDVPLMLMPVRLETRLRVDGDPPTVDVRIFPDDIHVESHEPDPTDGEVQKGKGYWRLVWRAGRNENAAGDRARILLGAWDQLSAALGPARARWIAARLTPKPDNRPDAPLPDKVPGPEPTFPPLPTRARGWNKPAVASTLPDRFVALAYQTASDGRLVLVGQAPGSAVPDKVQMGPDPDAGPTAASPDLDPELLWLSKFQEAQNKGLAIKVPLNLPGYDPTRTPLLTRVLVLGVSASLDPEKSAARVGRLLAGRAADGQAAFVAQGTPTNNIPSARRTASPPPDVEELLKAAAAATSALPPADPWINGDLVAEALGVPRETVAALPGAREPEQADARALQLALWSATGDFFLDELLESESQTQKLPVDRSWLRRHYADLVRARGPLPALRIGKQPYGLLPVTATARWQPNVPAESERLTDLHRVLTTLRPFWEVGVETLPRVGGRAQPGTNLPLPKPELDVLHALGMAPVSRTCGVRGVRGMLNACFTNKLADVQADCPSTVEDRLSKALNRALGITYEPVVSHHQNEPGDPRRLWLPLARITPRPGALDPVEDFLLFLEGVVERFEIPLLAVKPEKARTLLEALLRHTANLEYGRAAAAVAGKNPLTAQLKHRHSEVILSPEVSGAVAADAGVLLRPFTAASLLALDVRDDITGSSVTVHEAVKQARQDQFAAIVSAAHDQHGVLTAVHPQRPWSARLVEIDAALRHLALRAEAWHKRGEDPFAPVERLLGECLDLVSHRLDAWITSLATARLKAMRAPERRPTGVQLGAYGWVENLSRRPDQSSDGCVLAPSIPQATTAAILHSGYLSHASDPGAFAVDLSSRRMRVAMDVLDGVRQGQPIGALLGYRLERRLHDARERPVGRLELDRVIAPLRKHWPSQPLQHDGATPGTAQEFIGAHDVTDGAALGDLTVEAAMQALVPDVEPALNPTEEKFVREQLEALHADIDAVADLLLAEGVHQLAHGNTDRVAATVDSLAAGGEAPPRPQVLDTPAHGTPVTHRIMVVVPRGTRPAAGWDGTSQRDRPRALAEPPLDAWASHQLGPADRIRLRARWIRPGQSGTAAPVRAHDWPLTSHCALDVLALVASGTLRDVLADALVGVRPDDVPSDARPELEADREDGWPRTTRSLLEVEALAAAVNAVLAVGRPGSAADLTTASASAPPAPGGDAELFGRAKAACDGLDGAKTAEDLAALARYGVVVPRSAEDGTPADHAAAAVRQAETRLARAREALPENATPQNTPPEASLAALEAVFGPGFRAVRLVTVPDADELRRSFTGLKGTDEHPAPHDWLEQMATVRPGAAVLADLLLHTEAAGTGRGHGLRVGQRPFDSEKRWVGAAKWTDRADPATAFVVHGPAGPTGPDLSQPVAVLVVDEWTEVIPAATHTAGAAFHFDAPGARAPHAVLLAVPPVAGSPWTLDTLADVVGEALDLAKLRLVDLTALGWLGRYLPAAYLPDSSLGNAPTVGLKAIMKQAVVDGLVGLLSDGES
ncbi:hypothetical protein [Streptomyces purpureus]|uniref:Uncharacterized protein n=1 Tax=Streptomyces purpureus TaxID=1951 RepID=A0A918GWV0_9ACTN|nr:hypothetical protein [Streptomyces purpureus]GGT14725.1 hypothetical protein GCM10014713_04350 [Streptomyces purpureus]